MRIALCQIDTTVGDVNGNAALVLEFAGRAAAAGAELALFPEMAIHGYPAKDLLEFETFLDRGRARIDWLNEQLPLPALVGFAERADDGRDPPAWNAAALIGKGITAPQVFRKTLLPTYDVFDEGRYFRPAAVQESHVFDLDGVRFGVTICEDMWNQPELWPDSRYVEDPIQEVVRAGASVILNLSASPFAVGKPDFRRRLAASHARRHGTPLILCNLVGGTDDLIFDGASFAVDAAGKLISRAAFCAEDLSIVEIDGDGAGSASALAPEPDSEISEIHQALNLGLRDYAGKCGFERAVLGLSGGIDSAVVAVLACQVLGADRVTGIAMPSRYSSQGSLDDARALAANLEMELIEIPIEPMFTAYLETLAPILEGREPDVTEENLQARIRGAILMAHSNKLGSLLLTTGNKSELAVGYCTLYGDMCGGLAVISDVLKTRVYELARLFNAGGEVVPESTFTKPPSAELRPDQRDEDSLPPYEVLDAILGGYIEEGQGVEAIARSTGHDLTLVRQIVSMVDRNEYKRRQMPPGLRVTGKAFGLGRRFPIAMRRRHLDGD